MGHRAAFDVAVGETDARERLDDAALEQRLGDEAGEAADLDVVLGRHDVVHRSGKVRHSVGIERFYRRHMQHADLDAASGARSVISPVAMIPTSLPSRSRVARPIAKRYRSGSSTTGTLPRRSRM